MKGHPDTSGKIDSLNRTSSDCDNKSNSSVISSHSNAGNGNLMTSSQIANNTNAVSGNQSSKSTNSRSLLSFDTSLLTMFCRQKDEKSPKQSSATFHAAQNNQETNSKKIKSSTDDNSKKLKKLFNNGEPEKNFLVKNMREAAESQVGEAEVFYYIFL